MDYVLEITLSGLVSGLYYAALATALSLVFGISKVVNFAHGEFIMVGGFAYLAAAPLIGPVPALVAAFLASALIAYVFHELVLRPQGQRQPEGFAAGEYQIITTFALGMLLLNAALTLYGPEIRSVPAPFDLPRIRSSVLSISGPRLGGLILCATLLAAVYLFLMRTSLGRLLRAASQNPSAVSTLGVNSDLLARNVFAAGGGLAGFAGAVIAPVFSVYPEAGVAFALKSFVVVVLGGFGSFTGTVLGGLLLGLVEAFGGAMVSTAYKDAFGFLLLLLVLLVRPAGLMGERARSV